MSQQELQIQDTPHGDKDAFQAITAYLLERVEEFRQLCVLRKKVSLPGLAQDAMSDKIILLTNFST